MSASEPIGPAVDEQRQRRDGLEPARGLQLFELGVPRGELLAASDEDRLPAPDDVAAEHRVVERHERERRLVGRLPARDEHQPLARGDRAATRRPASAPIDGNELR